MKTSILIFSFCLFPFCTKADDVTGMVIKQNDGTNTSVVLSKIQNIKFKNGQMIITQKDDKNQSISLDDIVSITFDQLSTAVQQLTNNQGEKNVQITDLNGKVIFKGKAEDVDKKAQLHGVFLITTEGITHKVVLKK